MKKVTFLTILSKVAKRSHIQQCSGPFFTVIPVLSVFPRVEFLLKVAQKWDSYSVCTGVTNILAKVAKVVILEVFLLARA